jgi:hypothetical protein
MLIDPDFSGDELRSKIYGGDLVILTRLQALADLASFNRRCRTARTPSTVVKLFGAPPPDAMLVFDSPPGKA